MNTDHQKMLYKMANAKCGKLEWSILSRSMFRYAFNVACMFALIGWLFNLNKITSLTHSTLLICRGVWDLICRRVWDLICRGVWDLICRGVWDLICRGVWHLICRGVWDLICRGVWDLKKQHYGCHASVKTSWIINDMINTAYDHFRPIGLVVATQQV